MLVDYFGRGKERDRKGRREGGGGGREGGREEEREGGKNVLLQVGVVAEDLHGGLSVGIIGGLELQVSDPCSRGK